MLWSLIFALLCIFLLAIGLCLFLNDPGLTMVNFHSSPVYVTRVFDLRFDKFVSQNEHVSFSKIIDRLAGRYDVFSFSYSSLVEGIETDCML